MTDDKIMHARRLGANGPEVYPIALGCMSMSGVYGESDDEESISTIHAAIDAGINLFDTGDFYAMGHNEMLLGRALKGKRDKTVLSVKFGAMRGPDGSWLGFDSRPAAIKNFLSYTLKRLGVDHIDIYRPARLDPNIPIEETVGTIAELIQAGYVRHVGLSEVGPKTIQRAVKVHPICDLQIEYSLLSRAPEAEIFPLLEKLGIGVTAYGVLSRGLLSGSKLNGKTDMRAHMPRFAGDNFEKNLKLAEALKDFAKQMGVSASQVAIAWVRAKGKNYIPLIGARNRAQLSEALGALPVTLSKEQVKELEALVPAEKVAGTRYAAQQMQMLDSERKSA